MIQLTQLVSPFLIRRDVPEDDERCKLLGPTALVVQGLLGVLVILSLVYKRQHEDPKRKWRIWLFDVSKQVVGQVVVHVTNVFLAALVGGANEVNPCAQYFLHVLLDTTVGVAILYTFLRLFTHIITRQLGMKGFETGQYGTPPSFLYWSRQAAVYVVALLSMKIIVLAIVAFATFLSTATDWLLSWFSGSLQVVFVMGIFPIVMNVLQFWIVDNILKSSAGTVPLSLGEDIEREPIFSVTADGDEDEGLIKRTQPLVREHSYPPSGPENNHATTSSPNVFSSLPTTPRR